MHRFARISNYIGSVFKGQSREPFLSIVDKVRQQTTFEKAGAGLERGDEQLIFQRINGFKHEQPGSG